MSGDAIGVSLECESRVVMTQLDAEFVDVVERSEMVASEHVPEHGA